MQLDVVELAKDLIGYESVSLSTNVPVIRHLAKTLKSLKFQIEELSYTDPNGVAKRSLVARLGQGRGGLSLMSHVDVVPAINADEWTTSPFEGHVRKNKLYGRGSCDMKGPLAATICAAAQFNPKDLKAPLYIVVTGDEETHCLGAWEVVRQSRLFREASSGYGIICEPTRLRVVHAHKGSMAMKITSKGRAAHTSTLKGVNANIKMIPFLAEMKKIHDLVLHSKRYRNDEFKPPHSEWSIGINDNNIALNVNPVQSVCTIGYRAMPGVDVEGLIERTRKCARQHGLKFELRHAGKPLYTSPDSPLVRTALKLAGKRSSTTVPYGTDGVALVTRMKQLVVLGPGDIAQAHTVDEWIDLDQLHEGMELYTRFIDQVCVRELA